MTNHQTGDRAVLTIKPWHSVGRDYKGISGAVFDQRGNKHYEITGTWDGSMSATVSICMYCDKMKI